MANRLSNERPQRVGEHERARHEHHPQHHGQAGEDQPQLSGEQALERRPDHDRQPSTAVVSRRFMVSRTAVGGRVVQFADHRAVGEEDDAVGVGGRVRVVGHHDDGLAERADRVAQEAEHLGAGARVEVAGGLVGEDHFGTGDQRPGARDALLLPAGQLRRAVPEPVAQADGVDDRVEPRLVGLAAGDRQRQQDVLLGAERRQQVELLEDEADLLAAQLGQRLVASGRSPWCRRCRPRPG